MSCLADLGKHEARWDELRKCFDEHPLLGVEVLDEALVLYKNATNTCGRIQMNNESMILNMSYSAYGRKVTAARGGRSRRSTTPTLKGYFDDETCRLEPIDNPFGAKVLPMSPECTCESWLLGLDSNQQPSG